MRLHSHSRIDSLSWEVFFREFKILYGTPKLLQSDGSTSLLVAKEKVFPGVRHQLCKFHKLRNLVRVIYGTAADRGLLKRCVRLARHIFSNGYVSSRKSAARRLQEVGGKEVSEYVQEHIISCWRKLSLSLTITINVSERFNRKIEKSMGVRYGIKIKSEESARVMLRALWLN